MSNAKFKLDYAGIRKLLRSDEMQKIIQEKAGDALKRLGPGYNSKLRVLKTRAKVEVFAETPKAKSENSKNNTILKAVK